MQRLHQCLKIYQQRQPQMLPQMMPLHLLIIAAQLQLHSFLLAHMCSKTLYSKFWSRTTLIFEHKHEPQLMSVICFVAGWLENGGRDVQIYGYDGSHHGVLGHSTAFYLSMLCCRRLIIVAQNSTGPSGA